jgi:non-specific serine/threonine protein kinase
VSVERTAGRAVDEPLAPGELRARRQSLGLTQGELARALSVASNTVARWERGESRAQHAERLRQVLDGLETPRARRPRHNLPRSLTSFVAREVEAADIEGVLQASRLLTLTGAAGIGKTRLALEVAAAKVDQYPDGVWWVDLSPLADSTLVPLVTAEALGVQLADDLPPIRALAEAISDWTTLVILDNCEHLVAVCAELVHELLRSCGNVRILTTSRQPLGVAGEAVWRVAPLPLPDAGPASAADEALGYAAVRLFADRAAAAAPGFVLTDRTAAPVAEICRRLEGIPLAIELAASRVRMLGVEQIEELLDDRLRVLIGGARTQPQRQQTLRSTFDWSYALLDEAERVVLRRLSIFAGGFTLEAAEAICGGQDVADVFAALSSLVDKSLVQVEGDEHRTRYRLLETLRQYAAERLAAAGELTAIARRHRDWYVSWTERILPELTRRDQVVWYARLAAELDNCRAANAFSHAEPDGGPAAIRLAGALGRYWHVRAPGNEGREWLSRALSYGPDTPSAARARALTWSGQLEYLYGDAELGQRRLEEAVAIARQVDGGELLCLTLRHLALYTCDHTTAPGVLEEAASVARTSGAVRELSLALAYRGAVFEQQGDAVNAETLYSEALSHARACGDAVALMDILDRLGALAATRKNYQAAARLLNESLALSETIGYGMYTSLAHRRLAQLALSQDDLGPARLHAHASLQLARALGRHALGLWPLELAAVLAARLGHYAHAVRIAAALATWRTRHPVIQDQTLWTKAFPAQTPEGGLQMARAALGSAAFEAAWAEGSALSLEAAMDDALADHHSSGRAATRNDVDAITPRERQVAELVGRGLSNRHIAERLVITEGTAKVHVGRVLGKLGLRSRAQIAAWAVQNGLLESA